MIPFDSVAFFANLAQYNEAIWPAQVVAFALGLVALVGGLAQCGGTRPAADEHAGHDHEQGALWTCSMHPQIRAGEPGQCPICGMDLIPVETGNSAELGPDEVALSDRFVAREPFAAVVAGDIGVAVRSEGQQGLCRCRVRRARL